MSKIISALENRGTVKHYSYIIQSYHDIGIPVTEAYHRGRMIAVDNDGILSVRMGLSEHATLALIGAFLAAYAPQFKVHRVGVNVLLCRGDAILQVLNDEWFDLPL